MPRETHVIPWTQPLLPQLAAWLCAGQVSAPWDLSDVAVVVPTRQAGRRLRAVLAERAREIGTGILAPHIATPEWIEAVVAADGGPSHPDQLAAWGEVLKALDLDEVRALVPVDPPRRDGAWALGFAEQLARLKTELNRALIDFHGVATRTSGTDYEPERWASLALIEDRWRARLAERSFEDPFLRLARVVDEVPPPPDIRRIVVAAVPDLSPVAERILARWSDGLPVQVVVHGAPELSLHDAWGRPATDSPRRPLKLDGPRCAIRSLKDPAELARRVAGLAEAYTRAPSSLSITLADPNLVSTVAAEFEARGLGHHDPAGRPLARSAIAATVRTLAGLAGEDGLGAAHLLARNPAFCAYASGRVGWFQGPVEFSVQLDALAVARLPSGLGAAIEAARAEGRDGLRQVLEWFSAAAARFRREPFFRTLSDLVAEVHADARVDAGALEEAEAAAALARELASLASVEARHASLPGDFWPALLGRLLNSLRLYPARPDEAWDLQGWMEIAFDPAPHLVVGGFNEGSVPETTQGDPFMPETLRRHLGLESNDRRQARDRLLLEAAVRSRSESGRVDILVPKLGGGGDPLQPSRLLFACSDEELIATARYLFEPLPPPEAKPPRVIPWRLKALPATLPQSLSASAIRAYLDCPYRYYLEYGLRARPLDTEKRDLDPTDFGTLCHAAFEAMAKDSVMREVEDEAMLAEFLVSQLNAAAAERFGRLGSFAVKLQLEAAAARLRAAATVEAAQRAEGWRTVETERSWSLEIGGFRFGGVIDRIDRHADGRIRVLDYKTADKAKSPRDTHWATVPVAADHVLPEARLEVEGRARRWTDLQLPLYVLATRVMTGVEPAAGYFILPKTKEETEVRIWEELGADRLREAESCAVAVARAIAAGRFWPPAPRRTWDEAYEALFPEGIESAVEPGPFAMMEGRRT